LCRATGQLHTSEPALNKNADPKKLMESPLPLPLETIALYATPLVVGYAGYRYFQNHLLNKTHHVMREKAKAKRLARDNVIHETLSLTPDHPQGSFIDMDGVSLTEKICTGEISCTDAVIVCSKRANSTGKKLSAVTEECYDDAYAIATSFEERRSEGKVSFEDHEVLFGVPVSIKDGFQQKGYDCTMGTAVRCFAPYPEDGLLVKALKHAGAVPFVRSNIPQLLMMPESENIIWGVCANPWDVTRTSGGSSGGEASLISSRCSVSGLGSDVGGSIRIPAHYTGICGFKPTPMRMSSRGQSVPRKNDRNGQIAIRSTCGPMARR
jgi:fatty acid amide hydrolase